MSWAVVRGAPPPQIANRQVVLANADIGDNDPMPNTIACSAELIVHHPAETTLALFTAEGERSWVPVPAVAPAVMRA